ncbi:MAG: hypothetical protein AB7E49_11215 [Campylobacterales bacterium]
MPVETAQIDSLPLSDKIQLLEGVCDALYREGKQFESPAWHEEVLKSRDGEFQDKDKWLSLEEVRSSLRK